MCEKFFCDKKATNSAMFKNPKFQGGDGVIMYVSINWTRNKIAYLIEHISRL